MKIVRGNRLDSVFTFLVFVIFTLSVLLTLMFSASVYRNVSEDLRAGYNERTALSYVWTKIRSFDEADSLFVGYFHGQSALVISERHAGMLFFTIVYHYNGWLRELPAIPAGAAFGLADGLPLLELSDLRFREIGNGIIEVSSDDQTLLITQRSQLAIPLPSSSSGA